MWKLSVIIEAVCRCEPLRSWQAKSHNVRLSETLWKGAQLEKTKPGLTGPSQAGPSRAKAEEDRAFSVFSPGRCSPEVWLHVRPAWHSESEEGVGGRSRWFRTCWDHRVKVTASFILFFLSHCFDVEDMISSNAACSSGSTGPENHFPLRWAGLCWRFFLFWVVKGHFCFLPPPSCVSSLHPLFLKAFFENLICFL